MLSHANQTNYAINVTKTQTPLKCYLAQNTSRGRTSPTRCFNHATVFPTLVYTRGDQNFGTSPLFQIPLFGLGLG